MMELRGDIPGLLQRGSPVTRADGVAGLVSLVYASGAVDVATADQTVETESPGIYALYLGSRTGRFHAREWLRDRGHDVGNEDRAEVLAWSVLSVWRGGKPLRGVMLPWEPNGLPSMWMRRCERGAEVLTYLSGWRRGHGGYMVPSISYGPDAIKAEADAATLALGWALTNPDGTLTLPPLPGAK